MAFAVMALVIAIFCRIKMPLDVIAQRLD